VTSKGTAAAKAEPSYSQGDTFKTIDGEPITSYAQLQRTFAAKKQSGFENGYESKRGHRRQRLLKSPSVIIPFEH